MIYFRTFIVSLCVILLGVSTAAAQQVVKIKPRPGVVLKMLADDPGGAKAVAVLFPGGKGKVNVKNNGTFKGTKGNFLTRSRKKFSAQELVTVLFDATRTARTKRA